MFVGLVFGENVFCLLSSKTQSYAHRLFSHKAAATLFLTEGLVPSVTTGGSQVRRAPQGALGVRPGNPRRRLAPERECPASHRGLIRASKSRAQRVRPGHFLIPSDSGSIFEMVVIHA